MPPRLSAGSTRRRQSGFTATPAKTIQIPLNDDTAEKAKRHKRRTILHDMQMNKIAAAVTPGSRRVTLGDGVLDTPVRGDGSQGGLDAVTPMRKVPILANFEEWMKLATDNKINATNSWNFALIDYFYDMSLLKEGEGINFQKASCTLDGCVKIYTNRVDSVATETGKLLSGLADSTSRKKGRGDEDEQGSDAEAEEDGEGEGPKKTRRKAQRSSEATLAKDFQSLQIKKLELEFSVDPLFKKASADFDEGGAKGLLLNHLSIDSNGKIVFDSSDDKKEEEFIKDDDEVDPEAENEDGTATPKPKPTTADKQEDPEDEDIPIDISVLAARFFPDLSRLDTQDVCPSLKGFEFGDSTGALNIPFLKALEEERENEEAADNASDDGGDMEFGFDDDGEGLGFGEGGEVWANETIADAAERFMSPAKRPAMMGLGGADGEEERFGEVEGEFRVGFGDSTEGILSYFDEALKKNWAGPEHWRIRKIKDSTKMPIPTTRTRRADKESFEIDFRDPSADVPPELLLPPKTRGTTTMLKKDQGPKSRYLLPDDKLFNSRQLLKLFLKPKATIQETRRRRLTMGHNNNRANTTTHEIPSDDGPAAADMDEEFWAKEDMAMDIQASSTPDPKVAGNYDPNFFQDDTMGMGLGGLPDDDDDEDEFADAREAFSPGPEGAVNPALAPQASQFPPGTFGGNVEFGSQLVTGNRRARPEYVQYARVAKKVDVRKLKENLWTGLAFEAPTPGNPNESMAAAAAANLPPPEEPRKFTKVMNDLQRVYPQKTMADISTSYCFICLLHLANEKGLVITGSEQLTELSVVKDENAEAPDGY